jgi:hypothetical protein
MSNDDFESSHGGFRFFDEGMLPDNVTSDAQDFIQFDWNALAEALGEIESSKKDEPDFGLMAHRVSQMLRWMIEADTLEEIGRRSVALSMALNDPGFMDRLRGAPLRPKKVDSKKRQQKV